MDLSKPQFGASSSSSSSSTHSFTHDVFLSFRGEDTRNDFTGHLHSNLVKGGINTFIDNDLTRGEDIRKELLEVIEGSRISIVVFSANYASSKWCLDELVKIFQCKESKQQIVYPIFYKVDPSDIRHQKGQVGAHLSKYKDNKKVESWKKALTQGGELSGWHISDGRHEANVIDEIVKEISTQIMKCTPLDVATYPVGIESRVKDILKLLNVGEDDPLMIGIWGIGGIGKTTLAKAVYNSISHKFEHRCFLANVREESLSRGLVKLQKKFLSKIIERNPPDVSDVHDGITKLKQKLSKKRVLLVLDDVDCLDQLKKLAGYDWFGSRSKIIITTRDTNCLSAHQVNSILYEVKELNDQEASELFNFNAFKGSISPDDFLELATKVRRYAKGIPLVLEVLGSNLCSKNKDEWKDALEYYRRYSDQEIQKTLQRSYEALPDPIKEVFLHIACFFKGDEESYVIDILQRCDLMPKHTLRVLVEKALIKIEKNNSIWRRKENRIWMHDLIEDMGKEIVRKESPDEIGKRSRLWLYEDVREVLEKKTGTDKIKVIVLKWNSREMIQLNGGSFTKLKNLQIFIVPNRMGCSFRSLPESFNPKKLGMLRMRGPCTTPVIKGLKNLPNLKSIQLDYCPGLTRIPDLSGLTSLEYLELSDCDDLVKVHPSVGRLDKLVILKLSLCEKLQTFQKRINMKSLETLVLSECPLKFFPEIEGDMKSLNRLVLSETAIKELPCSVGNLTGLKSLSLYRCENLTNVPLSIFYRLQRLEDLDLRECSSLVTFPTKSEALPPPPVFSTNLTKLQVRLDDCTRLEEISEFPREIDGLSLKGCGSLERISKLSKILEGKDSKMFGRLDLTGSEDPVTNENWTDCERLCDNLARRVVSEFEAYKRLLHLAKKRKKMTSSPEELMEEAEKLTALLSLFFSCAKSEEFLVEFPAMAPIPNWFTCRQDVNSKVFEHEFSIEIPQNSNWDNKGLALCIQSCFYMVARCVYINGVEYGQEEMTGGEVWVHYIPFVTVMRRLSECGMPPPDIFRVKFHFVFEMDMSYMTLCSSCGVHLIEDLEGEGR